MCYKFTTNSPFLSPRRTLSRQFIERFQRSKPSFFVAHKNHLILTVRANSERNETFVIILLFYSFQIVILWLFSFCHLSCILHLFRWFSATPNLASNCEFFFFFFFFGVSILILFFFFLSHVGNVNIKTEGAYHPIDLRIWFVSFTHR